LAVTVVLCVTCLVSAFTASKLLGYDMGTAAGLLAGAFTESTVIGTAADAINRLALPAAEKTALVNNIPVAYAVTYLVGTAFIVPERDTIIRPGDVLAVMTRSELLMARGAEIGPEVNDTELLDFPVEVLDVVVTSRAMAGKTMKDLAAFESAHGVFLQKLVRLGQPMPFTLETGIDRGDVLSLIGAKPDVERAAKDLGYPDRPTVTTDMIFVGLGIFIGGLVGLLTVTVGGLPLTLTASGGALIMGLVFGWLRSVRPTFGRIPEAAMWVFET